MIFIIKKTMDAGGCEHYLTDFNPDALFAWGLKENAIRLNDNVETKLSILDRIKKVHKRDIVEKIRVYSSQKKTQK